MTRVVERFGVVVGQARFAKHVQIGLAVQVRRQVAVHPRLVGLLVHVDRSPDGCGQPAHQLGLNVTVDGPLVDLDSREPAVVLLEPEQRSGEVEQHRARRRHVRARDALSSKHVPLPIVGHHGRGPVELGGGLGVPAQPGQQFTAHAGQQIGTVESGDPVDDRQARRSGPDRPWRRRRRGSARPPATARSAAAPS